MTIPDPSFKKPNAERYRPLEGETRLLFWRDACLASRSTAEACRRCEEACPVAALRVHGDGPERVADCLGCGRCTAACPTGALAVKGFQNVALPNSNAAMRVECWKVPHTSTAANTIRVPCLGGVTLPQLLSWYADAPERPVRFVEHGWCTACSAGRVRHPGNAVLHKAIKLLEACGQPAEARPAWESQPLALKLMPGSIPDSITRETVGRRAFFRRFVSEVTASAAPPESDPVPIKALRRQSACPMPAREQETALLKKIAAHYGRASPDTVRPMLKISPGCQHHAVCSGICPTGALAIHEEAGQTEVVFDPDACVACGLCKQSCPEGAISLQAEGGASGIQLLSTYKAITCVHCHCEFAGVSEDVCPACRKRQQQTRNLFGTFNAL